MADFSIDPEFQDQLDWIRAFVKENVETLDLADVPPTSHPFELVNVLRPDVRRPTLDREEVLAQAPAVQDHRFRVPPVLGEEP